VSKDKWYNVVAHQNGSRLLKETLKAESRNDARDLGRKILRGRGFDPSKIKIDVVDVNSGWLGRLGV